MQMQFDFDNVCVKTYPPPEIKRKEILRYAGVSGDAPELDGVINECVAESAGLLVYKICYRIVYVSSNGDELDFGLFKTSSSDLLKNLSGCGAAIIFAATVGTGIDRLIAKYNRLLPSKGLMMQSFGNERVESLCDAFNSEITEQMKSNGYSTRPRFSPGYGDLTLNLQKDIFAVLDCPRKIGLMLNESLLMSPSKSVTAIIGITNDKSGVKK